MHLKDSALSLLAVSLVHYDVASLSSPIVVVRCSVRKWWIDSRDCWCLTRCAVCVVGCFRWWLLVICLLLFSCRTGGTTLLLVIRCVYLVLRGG